ncbi:hypothetical protein AGABI2DRAFT_115652 [Agaricus bisporus var. bisporus H97]|uniref:hypothetical protein n=1 Tax=Agaricus bisporus var. bisporus (strain H97 / ATCC MYA-4626 / FGSC 10389) TaxID=936046 RepID=UPI00029F509F|nr:hypothetical protein AGABI2DRAFT_115652 [Agaricus bisporus var. bisporus H97]EKV50579.1 hypothetical protein AGABI2DRAFT_115652 [Agaricus bisporus var. bisporus H97]
MSNCYLPSELLLNIFGFLEYEDLYTLTQTSTHFSHLSLISYFAQCKVSITPDGRVDLPDAPKTMEMLPFLRKARFIKSINRLSCGIVQPHRLFLEHISDLAAILRHTRSVEKFTLDFYVSGEPWSISMVKQINAGNALFNALNELFTLATRVCRSVMVRNGTALRAVLKESEKGGSRKGLSSWSLTRLFVSDKSPKRTSNSIPDSLSPPVFPAAPAKGALRVLEINSILLLSSPFIGWTIRSLNANDITDLIFGTIEHREIYWNTLLSQLHVPTLKCITFRGHTPFNALINFASRHRAITTMTLNNIDMEGWFRHTALISAHESFNKLVRAFENIKKLACCPRGLVLLLSNFFSINNDTSHVDLFPNLQSISVLWSVGIGQQLKMSVVEAILAPIAEKLKAYENVSFVVTYRTDVGACIRLPSNLFPDAGEPRSRPTIDTETDIPNITTRPPTSLATLYTGITSTSDKPPSSLFTIFNEIKIELTSRADRGGIPDLVKNLAESFTKIKYVRIDTRLRTGRAPEENKAWKLYLCHHALKHFGHLNVFFVDGTRTKVVGREG